MSIHQDIHALIDQLDADQTAEVLDYIAWLLADEDTLTHEEIDLVRHGEEQIDRGEFKTLEEVKNRISITRQSSEGG